jgi:hypothetical protein
MHCHFDLIAQDEVILDRQGIEVADLDQAAEEVLSVIREMRDEDPAAARDWTGCELRITDESGVLLTSIALDDPGLRHQGHPRPGLGSGH